MDSSIYKNIKMEKERIIYRAFDKIFKHSGLKYLYLKNKKNKKKCPVLLYHSLVPQLNDVSQSLFEEHIRYLSSNHTIMTLKEALQRIATKDLAGNELVISFDDGYEDNFTKALPILDRYNVVATFFITTGFIDQWYRGKKMMNKKQIRELSVRGMEIGSHTVSHPNLTTISKDQLKKELEQSKSELEYIIGEEVTSFSYPYGHYNKTVIDMCKKIGYKTGCTIFHDLYLELENKYEIPRLTVNSYDLVKDMQSKINGDHQWITPLYKLYYPHYGKY